MIAAETPYVEVQLTKALLLKFENETKMSSELLMQEYLRRCAQEKGETKGLKEDLY